MGPSGQELRLGAVLLPIIKEIYAESWHVGIGLRYWRNSPVGTC